MKIEDRPTVDELKYWQEVHVAQSEPYVSGSETYRCNACPNIWPCSTARLTRELDTWYQEFGPMDSVEAGKALQEAKEQQT